MPSAVFDRWLSNRTRRAEGVGTNAGATPLPFQGWRNFKEAFAPELIRQAVDDSEIPIRRCLDPFGGSGTTPLACQFLGVEPVAFEVNPFLADLIEAKLARHNPGTLLERYFEIKLSADAIDASADLEMFRNAAPPTFLEPGKKEKFVFHRVILERILQYRRAIEDLPDESERRLFRVLLGAALIPVSNVVISGKGRRYRRNWQRRPVLSSDVDNQFHQGLREAIGDIAKFSDRPTFDYRLERGDARKLVHGVGEVDLVVFSPPYPNSADYTDIYNVELWALGYLTSGESNSRLRGQTLSSHVQLKRQFPTAPSGCPLLDRTLVELETKRAQLWNKNIPAMIGAYFADLVEILDALRGALRQNGRVYIVLGDSRYADTLVPTAEILRELALARGYRLVSEELSRSMRLAPQQGGHHALSETLLVLKK